jgi:hypothetical protein
LSLSGPREKQADSKTNDAAEENPLHKTDLVFQRWKPTSNPPNANKPMRPGSGAGVAFRAN